MTSENNYFIKESYVPNTMVKTMDNLSGKTYWEKDRLYASRYYQYHVYQFVISLIKKYDLKTIADVGCGPATKLQYIHEAAPHISITGIDQDHPIQYCKANYDFGRWIVDDFENPGSVLANEKFDLVVCADVIEHLQDPDKLLTYIKNLSHHTTWIVLSTPERDFTRGAHANTCPQKQHIREWNMAELKAYVESRNFKVEDQFCLPDFKLTLNKNFIRQEISRLKKGLPKRNNQVLLLKKA